MLILLTFSELPEIEEDPDNDSKKKPSKVRDEALQLANSETYKGII